VLAAGVLVALLALAWHFNVAPRHRALDAMPDVLRAVGASILVFAIGGFGPVRLLLPGALRRYELLWVMPAGGCAVGLALTVLGFAGVPYPVSLTLVLVAGAGLGAYAVRRRGWPEVRPPSLAWPLYLAFVILVVALVPLVFVYHYAAPVGYGSDAHVATGVAQFLQHDYPTSVDISQPVNQMQPTWQSKYPIYYAFAAVSTVSGLATWQVLSILAATLLALTGLGMFLVAREVFRAPAVVALVAMFAATLDREALATVIHPYFNQTWGFFTLPFTLVLGWWAVQPGLSRSARQATVVLLALFALVLVLAYPLAAPIPAVPLIVFAFTERRRRVAARARGLGLLARYRGRRSLLWMIPLLVLLAVPLAGAADKIVSAAQALAPGHRLSGSWSGDLPGYVPWNYFFSLPNLTVGTALFVGVLVLAAWGLARQPRSLAWGLGGLMILALALALYLRHRSGGYYFEFKLLAFSGPLILLMAAIGAARLRRLGVAVLAALPLFAAGSAVAALSRAGAQLSQATIQLAQWGRSLPRDASIRLDMRPSYEIWAAYFLDSHPVCSQRPLLHTDYPHVIYSRKADYILAQLSYGRPADAIGPPLRHNSEWWLFRENPAVPGPSYCTRRRYDRIYSGLGHSPN
jgi:hypothetical protein